MELKEGNRPQVYPIGAERELARITLAYTNAMTRSFRPYMKEIMALYDLYSHNDSRFDDMESFRSRLSEIVGKIGTKFEKATKKFDLLAWINKAGKFALNTSIKDWVNLVKESLGLTVYKESYEELLSERLNRWVANNVSYVTTLPKSQLQTLQDIILWGYTTGQPKVNVYNRLQKQLGLSKSHARMLARDQLGTLNAQMMREEQTSMGCDSYKWKTRRDDRVRDCHRSLDGKIFRWDDPPAMWYPTKRGIVYTGRKCHPGEDYQCRCVAVPVFDLEKARQQGKHFMA